MSRKPSESRSLFGLSRGRIALIVVVLVFLWWRGGSNAPEPASQVLPPVPATVQAPDGSEADSLADALDQALPAEDSGFEAGSLEAEQAPAATAAALSSTPISDGSDWAAGSVDVAAPQGVSGLPTILYDDLPSQAQETIRLIDQGGPFPYYQDDETFQNRERILPAQSNGYYREYTVVTPGSDDRGARRIVSGADGELFYTDDHYDSFREVLR